MRKKSRIGILLALSAAVIAALSTKSSGADAPALETVPAVDLNRYIGQWYEIARYPNRFQRKCSSDTTATYSLKADGKISVVNECRESNGKLSKATGTARVTDKNTNAKLKVTFFWPFSGNYWVIGLGSNYEYAVVGEPSRKYLWVLSRTPQMAPALYSEAIKVISEKGYDPSRLITTKQDSTSSGRP